MVARINEGEPTLFVQLHRRDGCDRLGHGRKPEHHIRGHLTLMARIGEAERSPTGPAKTIARRQAEHARMTD
jgi:hypothetical protein